LNVSGTVSQPRPEGTIQLKRGIVNLFTTQFRLSREHENIARFSPNRGLDPYLDVRLITSVLETSRIQIPDTTPFGEVPEIPVSNLGIVETIRVQAKVEGYASQIIDIIELSSNPPRSETEIVVLLGGGFVNTLGRENTTLGILNLAGSALFSNFQNLISEALGLGEFRIFPTAVQDQEKGTSNIELAAEIIVDISDRFSLSALKILTSDRLPQLGIRYRLDDNLTLRGSTDFDRDTRFVVEYELRF
jgi:translocation and assembly module TamB